MGIKVLHLIDSGGLYGAEKMLLTLVKEQLKQGLEPMILSAGLPGEDSKALDLEARRLSLPIIQWPMTGGLNLKEGLRISQWAQKEHFDILHSHIYKFDILLGLLPKRLRNLPIIATSHGYTHKKLLSKMGLYSLIDRLALFFVEIAVTVSPHQKLLKLGPFSRCRKVIENGVEIEIDQPDSFDEKSNKVAVGTRDIFRICAVGRLSEEKGFDLLIAAVGELRDRGYDIHLSIAGDGSLRKSLERTREQLNLTGNVDFLGYISNVADLLNRSDLFVISSLTEGLPITLLEAMKSGVPVLATRVGAIPTVLDEGVNGKIIAPGSLKELVDGVENYLNLSSETIKAMILNARTTLRDVYSAETMSIKYNTAYSELINDD